MAEPRNLPAPSSGDGPRRARQPRCRLRRRALGVAMLVGALGATIAMPPMPRLVWNASASAPRGLYGVFRDAAFARGDIVIAWTPPPYRRVAAERHYLPLNVPLVKRVAAIPGDRVCAAGESLYINGAWAVRRLPHDGAGRPMPRWDGCEILDQGRYLLLMAEAPGSFDGRYFGPVGEGQIVGRAVPLWVR